MQALHLGPHSDRADALGCLQVPESRGRAFTLQTPVAAAVKLLDVANETLTSQGLTSSKVIMQWDRTE